jgi:hypothetical protein
MTADDGAYDGRSVAQVDWRLVRGLGHGFSADQMQVIGRWLKVTLEYRISVFYIRILYPYSRSVLYIRILYSYSTSVFYIRILYPYSIFVFYIRTLYPYSIILAQGDPRRCRDQRYRAPQGDACLALDQRCLTPRPDRREIGAR